MSEADRVFARMTTPGSLPATEDKEFLQVTSRRRGAVPGQSRVVEVVHRRSNRVAEPAQGAAWPEAVQGRPAPMPAQAPAATPAAAPPVGHLMPGWEPLLAPRPPAEPVAELAAPSRPRPRVDRPEKQPKPAKRAFADPFAAEDSGTNCLRCGYLVSPARERRGLTTCMRCR